jgi:predicted transcriptional regulator
LAISVRLDDEAQGALAQLEATGLSRSDAIKGTIVRSTRHAWRRDVLRQEMAALEQDDGHRREMQEVAEFKEQLRAEG